MKTIIAGSRTIKDYLIVKEAIKLSGFKITEVVSGEAVGVDGLGRRFGEESNIPVKPFPANWDKYGKGAGFIRNKQMADYAEACIVIWDGESKGSKNMLEQATQKGLKVFEFNLKWFKQEEPKLTCKDSPH